MDAAFERRAQIAEIANGKRQKTLKVALGDLVMVKNHSYDTDPNRVKKFSVRWTGPWEVMSNTSSGVTFTCRLSGRRVVYRTIHVSLMKKFRPRPDALQLLDPHAIIPDVTGLPRGQRCDRIEERKFETDTDAWQYKLRMRNNDLTPWLDEKRASKYVSGPDLDTFHALLELKHPDQLPQTARRPKAAPSHTLTVEEGLKIFNLHSVAWEEGKRYR